MEISPRMAGSGLHLRLAGPGGGPLGGSHEDADAQRAAGDRRRDQGHGGHPGNLQDRGDGTIDHFFKTWDDSMQESIWKFDDGSHDDEYI